MADTLHLFGVADLAERWSYTRQGVHKLAARSDFPPPLGAVNGGRIRVWSLADIEAFERDRPELASPGAKARKRLGYHLARTRGAR